MRGLGIIAGALLFAGPAWAQNNCGDRGVVIERLASKFGEAFAGGGLRNSQAIIEVWASEETGTWTILMTLPDGQSCVMAAGTNWRTGLPEIAGVDG